MFGVLSRNMACTSVNGVKFFVQGDCPPPEAFITLVQGVDNLDQQYLMLDPSLQVCVLVSGEVPFEVEGSFEVPAGRNLTIVGNSLENGDTRVNVNVTEELMVNGALQLERLELSREQSDGNVDVPLVGILDGGTAEMIQTEFRVNVGEVAIAINNGSLVLRDVVIAGELPASMAVILMLVASDDVGVFTDADRDGLVQAISSLADVPPAAVALTLEAANVRLMTFHICISGSAAAAATDARLKKLLPNATEAFTKLGVNAEAAALNISTIDGDSHCLGGIALQPPPPPASPSSPSGRRQLSDCVPCDTKKWPGTDRPSCSMIRKSITCPTMLGIKGYCAGSQHKENGRWFDTAHCQQTCAVINDNCCRPPPPPSPPPSSCVACDDKAPKSIENAGGEKCGDWRSVRGVELLLDKACSKEKWLRVEGYCRQSCSDAGCGYADCCPSPPSAPSPPSPPSSSAPPPSIAAAELADAPNVKFVGTLNGYAVISPRTNTTCIVDGVKTVVEGACSYSGRRLASVSTLALLGDTGAVLPAGSVTRRGLQALEKKVVLEIRPGETLKLSAIAADVQEVRLVGGGVFETEGSWKLPAGRTLGITAVDGARVKINVTGELAKVSGTLRLNGLDIFREPFDDGCGGCEVGFPPLLDILEGGTVEIVESELRVVVGELAIAVKGKLVLREAIIAGAPSDNTTKLSEFASDTLPVTAMELLGSPGAWFITGVEQGMRHHHCSHPEVFFEDKCQ